VKEAAKNVVDQAGDVVEAAKGTPRKGRKPGRKTTRKTNAKKSQGGSTAAGNKPYNTFK